MNQSYFSRTAVIAATAWGVVGLSLVAVWMVIMLPGDAPNGLTPAIALVGQASIGVAIVAHVRLYTVRVCCLIRATSGLECANELRPVP